MFKSKSLRAQVGKGPKSRDEEGPFASIRVSEDAQAKAAGKSARLVEFSETRRDRLPARPSTSAGPGSGFVKRKNAEKRETKDDLHFNPLAAHGKGTTFYNFPLPGSLPTPASSPTKSTTPPMPRKSSMKRPQQRPATPESMEAVPDVRHLQEPAIGMALGSPSHPQVVYQESPSVPSIAESGRGSSVDGWAQPAPQLKRKPSKWKILGGLFGTKKNDHADFYQVKPESFRPNPQPETIFIESPSALERPKSRGRGRTKSVKEKSIKDKPDMKRTNTAPLRFDMSGGRTQTPTPTPEIHLEGEVLDEKKGRGLLDVDIPVTKLDRYSVMFSSVLQAPPQNSSSLLARRQATLDKLKTVNEALASKVQELDARERQIMSRPASSPQMARSPAFYLFPRDQTRSSSPSRNRPAASGVLQRSNTSPAALSPARPTFAPGLKNPVHAALLESDPPVKRDVWVDTKGVIRRGPPPAPQVPVQGNYNTKPPPAPQTLSMPSQRDSVAWSPETSHLSLDSPEMEHHPDHHRHLSKVEECEKEDTYDPAPLPMRPIIQEPNWQMVKQPPGQHTANSSISNSSATGSEHSASTAASSVNTLQSVSSLTSRQIKDIRMRSPPQNPAPPANTSRQRSATVSPGPAARGRPRAATTTAATPPSPDARTASAIPRRKASIVTNGRSTSFPANGPRSPEEVEAHLKSAADLSIARQISISQQQRQLLQPLKTAMKVPTAAPISVVAGMNFMGKQSSPLSAVATAAMEERVRAGSPARNANGSMSKLPIPRSEPVVYAVKPSTPTLVVVDNDEGGSWGGAKAPLSLAERRRHREKEREKEEGGRASGEIVIGHLDARRELQHRKSERVVVEMVSVGSSVGGR